MFYFFFGSHLLRPQASESGNRESIYCVHLPECANVKHLLVKHREILNVESALFNGFFRLGKLSIFETLGKKLTCLTVGIYCMYYTSYYS